MRLRSTTSLIAVAVTLWCATGCESTRRAAADAPERAGGATANSAVLGLLVDAGRGDLGADRLLEHRRRDLYVVTSRSSLAQLLEMKGTPEELAACKQALSGDDVGTACRAAGVLAWHEDESGLEVVLAASRSANAAHQVAAVEALGFFTDARARTELLRLAGESLSPEVARSVAEALSRARDARAVPLLASLARSGGSPPSEAVQMAAISALGAIGGEPAVSTLAEHLDASSSPRARAVTAAALGRTLSPSAATVLVESLFLPDSSQPLSSIESALALLTYGGGPPSVGLGGRTTLRAAKLWDEWLRSHPANEWRRIALDRLLPPGGELSTLEFRVPILVLMLGSPQAWERRLAHESLSELAGENVVNPLRGLYDTQWSQSAAAAQAWQDWAASIAADDPVDEVPPDADPQDRERLDEPPPEEE